MKKFILIWALGMLASTQASAIEPAAVQAASQVCTACHGNTGVSTTSEYPNLAGQHSKYLAKQLREFKAAMMGAEGRQNAVMGGMTISLTPEMMDALSEYYSAMPAHTGETPESVIKVAESLYLGGDVERNIAACAACHGPRGNGTELSGFPKISGQNAKYLKLQLESFRSGERNNDLNGMMRDVAKKLTNDEIDALAQYLGGLH